MRKGLAARCSDSASKHKHRDNVEAFVNFFALHLEKPKAYLVTLQFREMGLDEDKSFVRVTKIVRSFMDQLTNMLVSDPHGSDAHYRPFAIAVLDRVGKKGKKHEVTVIQAANGTLHVHILVVPHPRGKVTGLQSFFEKHHREFLKNGIIKLHVKRITETPRKVARYALKSVFQRRYPTDTVMLFPEAVSEISRGPDAMERSEGDLGKDEVFLNRVLGRLKNLGDELVAKKVKPAQFLSSAFVGAHQIDEKYGAKAKRLVWMWLKRHKPVGASVPRKSAPTYALVLGVGFRTTHKARSKYKRKLDRIWKRVGPNVTKERVLELLSRRGKLLGFANRLKPIAGRSLSAKPTSTPMPSWPTPIDRAKVRFSALRPAAIRSPSKGPWYE